MKIENLVLTIEQAKHLQELGLDMSDAALGWFYNPLDCEIIVTENTKKTIPAYTLQEILAKLPEEINFEKDSYPYYKYINDIDCEIYYENNFTSRCAEEDGETLLEAVYKMLCWTIENKYLKSKTTKRRVK